ncbi:terminase large subunit [Magnetococcus sp. PR-3]|uniref:terminase large subunit n=1 Tax=Magnetococcus sp. PR-3 TaxID=3120355 RepID=UPI002FCE37C3
MKTLSTDSERDYVGIALQYARDVVSGKILACRHVRQACQRQLNDLERWEGGDDTPFMWNPTINYDGKLDTPVDRVCAFVESLPHVKGKLARNRERIRLQPWQVFILATIFGWVKPDGARRFRQAYLQIPRKNGKSILAAAVGLYMFCADIEHGAEVYSGATSEKQAMEVFRPARQMVERTKALRERFGIGVLVKNLHTIADESRFEPVIGKPGDGASPSCAIVDEYHEHDTDELFNTLQGGMGNREQPLQFVITTAGDNIGGPCYAMQLDVTKLLDGVFKDNQLFGIIYTIDKEDQEKGWKTEEAMRKANPNLGVSIFPEFLQAQLSQALRSVRKQAHYKTKYLNLWVSSRDAWMNMDAWFAVQATYSQQTFQGDRCWIGVDLSSKIDLTSIALLFHRDNAYHLLVQHYLPEDRANIHDNEHILGWATEGHLKLTDGNMIDYEEIKADILALAKRFDVAEIGYDPYGGAQLFQQLAAEGLNVVEVPQNVRHLSEPMKEVEAFIGDKRFFHDGNPVTSWMFSNVTCRVDANENIYPRKERVEDKIDGAVATIIAMNRAMAGGETDSVYEDQELLVL